MKKTCSRCKARRSVAHFDKCEKTIDGKSSWCKKCKKDYNDLRRKGDWLKMIIG